MPVFIITRYVQDVISVFTQTQFRMHFNRILSEFNAFYTMETLQDHFLPLLKDMCDSEFGFVFAKPVDPSEWRIPEYGTVVTRPMDLGAVQKRLLNGRCVANTHTSARAHTHMRGIRGVACVACVARVACLDALLSCSNSSCAFVCV
jgi:hypothetical protein